MNVNDEEKSQSIWKRLLWFVGLWGASVISCLLLSTLIRLWIK
ncbi:MAG: DUF2474 domain-containing protein [Pseudomonadota bacterium]